MKLSYQWLQTTPGSTPIVIWATDRLRVIFA
jgi:hypothetical protein